MAEVLPWALCAVLAVGLVFAGWRIEALHDQVYETQQDKHDECVVAILWHVKNEFAAITLSWAADKWESLDSTVDKNTLAREVYQPGGPSMPALWLRMEAQRVMEGKP